MIFTREIIENAGLLYHKHSPPINELDLSCECDGLVTEDLFRGILEHYARLGMSIYAIYIPEDRKYDVYRWMPINIIDQELIYNTIKNDKNIFLPKIVYVEELEGNECNKIWCHVLGVKDINEWRDLNDDVLSFSEAKEVFGDDGINWCHVKIG